MMSISRLSFIYLFMLSLVMILLGMDFLLMNKSILLEWEICSINSNMILMVMLFDWMSLMFMGFVLFISSLVIYYSESYMDGDMNINRFIMLVLMFVLSMMLMIISPNLISILLGWDGLGLVSYCLVIYYQNIKSFNAGMLTILMNRVGDVTMLLSIAWMLNYGSLNFLMYIIYIKEFEEIFFISFLLMISGMTKSAQIPFSSWLPAAMAAPTPVSALVHSSTLVTAGVYLLIRFNELIMVSGLNMWLLLISSLTMFMSGLGANYEFDLKKIIALSTLSQLGLMMSSLSFGMYKLAFFHLLMHAMFKALLFLCAGSIIHMMKNFQDIRLMGAMNSMLPLIGMIMMIANLALSGLPFLAGFYSKDLILEHYSNMNFNTLIYLLFYLSTGLTMSYSFRLTMILFMNEVNMMSLLMIKEKFDSKVYMKLFLLIMTMFGGSMFMWVMFEFPKLLVMSYIMKMMVVMVMIIGMLIGFELSNFMVNKMYKMSMLNMFLMSMWFMSEFSINYYNYLMYYSYNFIKVDQGWLELFSGQGILLQLNNLLKKYMNYMINNLMMFMISLFFWVLIILLMYLN
nr:NADH dehydrogenase subunit 5 [Aviostivalius klossi bispiniformis]